MSDAQSDAQSDVEILAVAPEAVCVLHSGEQAETSSTSLRPTALRVRHCLAERIDGQRSRQEEGVLLQRQYQHRHRRHHQPWAWAASASSTEACTPPCPAQEPELHDAGRRQPVARSRDERGELELIRSGSADPEAAGASVRCAAMAAFQKAWSGTGGVASARTPLQGAPQDTRSASPRARRGRRQRGGWPPRRGAPAAFRRHSSAVLPLQRRALQTGLGEQRIHKPRVARGPRRSVSPGTARARARPGSASVWCVGPPELVCGKARHSSWRALCHRAGVHTVPTQMS